MNTEDVTLETKWKKGQSSPNPNGRPKGTGRPISKVRSTLNKLKQLEPDAISVIEKSLKGAKGEETEEMVSKSQVDTAKWIISSIGSLTRTALAEESYKSEISKEAKESEGKATGTNDSSSKPVRFTTHIIEDDE